NSSHRRKKPAGLSRLGERKQTPEALHVVVGLLKLIMVRRVGNRGEMKNGVEFFVTKLFTPVQPGQVSGNKIATVVCEVLEIARAKVVDHSQSRIREACLQFQYEIRADKTGAAGHNQV